MDKKYRLILFDMDGTLVDTSPGIYNGYSYMLPKMGLPPLKEEMKPIFVGPALHETYPKYLGLTGDRMNKAIHLYRKYNNEQGYKEFEHYKGIEELLKYLKQNNYISAVVTMKQQMAAEKTIDLTGFNKYLAETIGNDDYNPLTKAELILKAIDKYGVTKEETLLIGDTEVDAKGAKEAEVDFFPAMFGFGFNYFDVTEDYPYIKKLYHPLDLISVLERNDK